MTVWKFYPPPPPPPMVGLVVELLRGSWAQRLVTCESLALWIWTGKRNNQKLGEIRVRKCTLEYLLNVLIMTMFCYCWSLFFTRQKKVHRRSKQLGVWEQYRSIRCMDVDIWILKKPTISIRLLVNFFAQINKPSQINCLMKYTVCMSMSLLNLLRARSLSLWRIVAIWRSF